MPRRRTLAAVLAAAALIVPAAAQAEPADMHASVAQAAAAQQARQDLRSPDARDAATPRTAPQPALDLRSPDARDAATRQAPPAGQPTWPVDPQPIAAPASEPVAVDSGSPVPVVPIVAGALLVLLAALIARYAARRTGRSTRVAA